MLNGEYELTLVHPIDEAQEMAAAGGGLHPPCTGAYRHDIPHGFSTRPETIIKRKIGGTTKIPPVRKPARVHFA